MEYESDDYTNCDWCSWYSHRRIGKCTEGYLEITGLVENIQTTALLRSARILRGVLEICGDLLSHKLVERPSANADVKNTQGVKLTIIIILANYHKRSTRLDMSGWGKCSTGKCARD